MNDMQIIIRKQLSNPHEKYKKIGIAGALSVVKAMGSVHLSRDAAAGSGSGKRQVVENVHVYHKSNSASSSGSQLFASIKASHATAGSRYAGDCVSIVPRLFGMCSSALTIILQC